MILGIKSNLYKSMAKGGIDTKDATATTADILNGKTAYVNGSKITGTIENYDDSVSEVPNLEPGNIKKDVSILGVTGTYNNAITGVSYANNDITINGSNADGVIIGDYFLEGITISGRDNVVHINNNSILEVGNNAEITATNLAASNIKSGVDILGVTGTYEGSSSGNTLKTLLDTTHSCMYIFKSYSGSSASDLISYNDTENVTNMQDMFYYCNNLVNAPSLNTSNVTNMNSMFYCCSLLNNVPLYDTSNVTDMSYMFYMCSCLNNVPLYDTSNVTNMKSMFSNCEITSIKFENTNKVSDMQYMFSNCHRLETIDISKLASSNSSFATRCFILKKLIIRYVDGVCSLSNINAFTECYHITGTTNSYNPEGLQDGYIYVPDNLVDSYKTATNWSTFATQIKGLSELPTE